MRNKRLILVSLIVMLLTLTACSGQTGTEEELGENGGESVSVQDGVEYPTMDPYGTYNENDLLIHSMEIELKGITADIPQIDGLKDKEIQNKINGDMQRRIEEVCESVLSLNFLEYYVDSNFANVISISVFYGSDDEYGQLYLNYNLVNGEKLDFEELFYEDTDTLEIVRNAFFEAMILYQMSGDISENEYYKIVKSFTDAKDKQFAFTPSKIYLYYKDTTASVKMLDIADEISIYSRYLTEESLYEEDNIGKKDIMTGVSIPYEAFSLFEFGYLHENCWYDITSMKEYTSETFPAEKRVKYEQFKTEKYEEVYSQIEEYGKDAQEHPENFYIILCKPSFYVEIDSEWNGEEWLEDYRDTAVVTDNFKVLEMSMETFESIYKDKILEAYRYDYLAMAGGIYLDVTEDEVQVKEQYNQKTYNYMTGEEVY